MRAECVRCFELRFFRASALQVRAFVRAAASASAWKTSGAASRENAQPRRVVYRMPYPVGMGVSKATARRRWLRSCRRQTSGPIVFAGFPTPVTPCRARKIERSCDLYKAKVRKLMLHFKFRLKSLFIHDEVHFRNNSAKSLTQQWKSVDQWPFVPYSPLVVVRSGEKWGIGGAPAARAIPEVNEHSPFPWARRGRDVVQAAAGSESAGPVFRGVAHLALDAKAGWRSPRAIAAHSRRAHRAPLTQIKARSWSPSIRVAAC
jgi:hypothetical protein